MGEARTDVLMLEWDRTMKSNGESRLKRLHTNLQAKIVDNDNTLAS